MCRFLRSAVVMGGKLERKRIELADLPRMIGKGVHVSWAAKACIWQLKAVEGETAVLITPKTRKRITTSIYNLQYIRKHIPKPTDMSKINNITERKHGR